MSSRYLHPIACRLPRAERNAIAEFARRQDLSVSALTKEALRRMLFGVHPGVNPPENFSLNEVATIPVPPTWEERQNGPFPRRPVTTRLPTKPSTFIENPALGWRD